MSTTVKVKMFGDFTIEYDGKVVDDNSNRARKVWSLLAYLIQNRERAIPQDELIDLVWGENEKDSDPRGALKAIFYRVRTTLDKLGDSAGHNFIISRAGAYAWNNAFTVETDADEFEKLISKARDCEDEAVVLSLCQQAIDLYSGPYLAKMSMDPWVIPMNVYYSNLYIETVLTVLRSLKERDMLDSIVRISRTALEQDPFNEDIYGYMLSAMIQLGQRREAMEAYETLRQQMYDTFSIQPSENIRELYREAMKTVNSVEVPPEIIREQLREQSAAKGALICDYDFFKVLYHSAARAIVRSGDVIHIAMFSITGEDGGDLSRRSLERAMDNLQEQIRINLRSGDSAARCSVSQFVVMLQQSNYENSCMVCDRIVRAYYRQYPHSPAEIRYSVQPLEPML